MARDSETMRYKQAAEDALQQLDWCIGYLHGIRKNQLSARLAINRTFIKRQLMREPTTPLPSSETSES
jgi:DNA-binding transcriptional regulator LsrR (DeoR family)